MNLFSLMARHGYALTFGLLLAEAIGLPFPAAIALVAAGAAWLALALLNGFVSPASSLKRLTSPAKTFLVMNAAALVSIAVFFLPAAALWAPTRVANSGKHSGS